MRESIHAIRCDFLSPQGYSYQKNSQVMVLPHNYPRKMTSHSP
ncbi:hypothetical protein GBAR_LOCUS31778 [Geodia barretti]|uniref:Uncharacterized protein n=1 Tax=Geodia barretti TaxID=519541 RepID=A0AA35XGX8_GEOBA|nr:hypothetical protein GBAR_LOCUS31778 [Geodia barretti]